MKIMHVTKKYKNAIGGDAIVVSYLGLAQQATGHNVIIVTSNCDEIQAANNIYKFGLKETATKLDAITLKRLLSLIVLFFRMFNILRKERPDILHTHSIDMAFIVSFAAKMYHIPIVHTFHIVTFYDNTQHILRRKTELWLAKKAKLHRATAPNMYDVKKLRSAGLSQTALLNNGVDLAFWKPLTNKQPSKEFTFLSVGRLERQKGYDYLIKAAAILAKKTQIAFRIIIVGEGSERVALTNLIQSLRLKPIITLVGQKKPCEVHRLFTQVNAAVFPSLYETTPLTLLEAWAMGVPVIATPVGILRVTAPKRHIAHMVPLRDETSLAKTMHYCMTNPLARTKIAQNGQAETKNYAWPTIARSAEAIYRSAL